MLEKTLTFTKAMGAAKRCKKMFRKILEKELKEASTKMVDEYIAEEGPKIIKEVQLNGITAFLKSFNEDSE